MSAGPVPPGADGFHHPASEAELVSLVNMARQTGRQLRVRGAVHSVSHVVYADPLGDVPNRVSWQRPPDGDNVQVMLDRYRGWRVRNRARKLVEADAGIHLGADPSDPTGSSSVEDSLLWQLWHQEGWTLSNLGGITHQTVSGFIATGSSGGSVQYSVNDNLWGFRVIDAAGNVREFTRDDADPDLFYAMSPNLGLLGVISKVILQCESAFNITGQEAITTVEHCAVDLFGPGTADWPSLEQFLREAEYARIEWWPQRGAERVVIWQAQRIRPQPGFRPHRYEEFTAHPNTAEVAISILLTVFGNLDDLSRARPQLEIIFARVEILDVLPFLEKLGEVGRVLADFFIHAAEQGLEAAITRLPKPAAHWIKREIPVIFPRLLDCFVPLDARESGVEAGEPQAFHDFSWQGLPMDNAADDEMLATSFTEMWVPLRRTQQVMQLLRSYFKAPPDAHGSYARTGLNAWELYAAKPTRLWMSASHTDGDDEWREGVFRIDPYWFAGNPGDPSETFYPQFWELLRDHEIPFRLHWGKYQPASDPNHPDWVRFFKSQYPRWDDFLALRAAHDPTDMFLTSYWRDRFGLWPGVSSSSGGAATIP